jgi:hypothetical protein
MLVAALVAASSLAAPTPLNRVVLRMAAPENKQYGATPFEPQRLLKPYVAVRLINPRTGKTATIEAYVDTGADHCVISGDVFRFLGLSRAGTATAKTFFGVGSSDLFPTEAEYEFLKSPREPISDFAKQRTHFYVSEQGTEALILGVRGFLDRFKEVILRYPAQEMEFVW